MARHIGRGGQPQRGAPGLEPPRRETDTAEAEALRRLIAERSEGDFPGRRWRRGSTACPRPSGAVSMWTVNYAVRAERDFELIFDHLIASYVGLSEAPAEALERPAGRVLGIRKSIHVLAVFFGAQDHVRPMLIRVMAGE